MDLLSASLANHTLECYLTRTTARSRIIYWLIIITAASGIGLLPFIYVDVSIQARGYFQADIEKQIVYAPLRGRITYTSVDNGERVEKGDTLLVIDSESTRALQSSLIKRIAENNASIGDLEKLTSLDSASLVNPDIGLLTKRYNAEFRNLNIQLTIQLQKYRKKKNEHERNELLYNQEIIPAADYENSLFILKSERDNIDQILLSQKSAWQNDLASRKNEVVRLSADLEQCNEELSERIVLSPTCGEILQSSDLQMGSIVTSGQKIAEITPDGDLIGTCFVRPDDIGLINEKQKVRIQVDAFNYREWGMLPGEIVDISDDMIVTDGSTAFFRIRCKPEKTFLALKDGGKGFLKKGMSFNARIVVIRRSLFHLLFDKADKWFNPYTYKKGDT